MGFVSGIFESVTPQQALLILGVLVIFFSLAFGIAELRKQTHPARRRIIMGMKDGRLLTFHRKATIDGVLMINGVPYKWNPAGQRPAGFWRTPTLMGLEGTYDLFPVAIIVDQKSLTPLTAKQLGRSVIVREMMESFSGVPLAQSMFLLLIVGAVGLAAIGVYFGVGQKFKSVHEKLDLITQDIPTPDPGVTVPPATKK